ncbi:MAG: MBL fold metallo-hydrolase [Clostridia bacterium]|nr:MBL fold metallo-hydrolase [Clostridia bacterium]
MKKTFITKMPDHAGAFKEASRIISAAGANIARVSYNKAVDMHTLFLDVSGTKKQLDEISQGLTELGYIQNIDNPAQVLLLEFLLKDVPGTVLPVLELIDSYHFNISYISSHENDTGFQNFKMGLFVEDPAATRDFLEKASALCEIRIIDYDESERVLDNTVFYMSFANRMTQKLQLPRRKANELMTQSNRIMQMLDERNEPPYKTFDYISRWADMLAHHKGLNFKPQISRIQLSDCEMICIQPPCGSNTCIFHKDGELLFIDSGFAIYAPEMVALLRRLFPGFDEMPRRMIITHPDMDHCGLLSMFDEIHVSYTAHLHFEMEVNGEPNYREQNPAHAPYCAISRILSRYIPPEMTHLYIVDQVEPDPDDPLGYIGSLSWQGKKFDFYRGNGGHVDGEVAIVCEADKIVFTGDITVNIKGFSPEQAAFNRLAPYLMTSVNMDSTRATVERKALEKRFPPEKYIYCCGHGAIWDRRETPIEIEQLA